MNHRTHVLTLLHAYMHAWELGLLCMDKNINYDIDLCRNENKTALSQAKSTLPLLIGIVCKSVPAAAVVAGRLSPRW